MTGVLVPVPVQADASSGPAAVPAGVGAPAGTATIDLGQACIRVDARPEMGHIRLTVHQGGQDDAHAYVVLSWNRAHAVIRSLELAVRLTAVTDLVDDCPAWCDPWIHAANWAPHGTDVGEFEMGHQSVNVSLYQEPGAPVLVGLLVRRDGAGEAGVDMPPDVAAALSDMLSDAMRTRVRPTLEATSGGAEAPGTPSGGRP